ncbi:hypothetical protein MPER_08853 [Moniliophthora perniciosa FA553]|nr:hypothetical protein MPER_08853 [Moniliophthora perniciosa FA553]
MAHTLVDNTGSTARDFCMLERNLLSHIKLALLLFLISCSLLLHSRLVPDPGDNDDVGNSVIGLPLASVEMVAALAVLAAGIWEYQNGFRDLMDMRAFLAGKKPYLLLMTCVVAVVIGTCIILLVEESGL